MIADGVDYGWSKRLASAYPFSVYASTISESKEPAAADLLVEILSDCAISSSSAASIALLADYAVAENDYLRIVYSKYGTSFREMIATLVQEGYAQTTAIAASASAFAA